MKHDIRLQNELFEEKKKDSLQQKIDFAEVTTHFQNYFSDLTRHSALL